MHIPLIQIGCGGVGQALIQQILAQQPVLAQRYDIDLYYHALVDSRAVYSTGAPLTLEQVQVALHARQQGQSLATLAGAQVGLHWRERLPVSPAIIIDVTAADGMHPALVQAVQRGHRVVLANKKPLTADYASFTALTAHGATRYEATVGAGLPTIHALQSLLDTGDTVQRIEASMSGTLGFLCTALDEGQALSAAVLTAYQQGYTEPDPRDDLSGTDVARKALILARSCGLAWTLDDVPSEPLFAPELAHGSVAEFLQRLPELDAGIAARLAAAQSRNAVLRYVATLELGPQPSASIALRELPLSHPLAALRGTDNLIAYTTARYPAPLVVRGAGAGPAVTAAGVLTDVIATARELATQE